MTVEIVPLAEAHFEELRAAFDAVARERRYLAMLQAPPREANLAFYRNALANAGCHFVALVDGAVAGWCDIHPVPGDARAHVGSLGIGLLPHARGKGIGRRLMQAAIARAWEKGLTRIVLSVRADNANAKALYESLGFVVEGTCRDDFRVDGTYYDTLSMALLR